MKYFLFFFCLSTHLCSYSQTIVINEIVSKATDDSADWIEIYNPGSDTISLSNYFLSDDINELLKWEFPSIQIKPKEFIIVYASNNSLKIVNSLQANFKIKSQGEVIYLTDKNKQIIDRTPSVSLLENQSFGRYPDGSNYYGKLIEPSPSSTNKGVEIPFSDLYFSHQAGMYQDGFELNLSPSYTNAQIYYTTDGSDPDNSSLLYQQSIFIDQLKEKQNIISNIPTAEKWTAPRNNVNKGTTIKAIVYLENQPISSIFTKSYFIWQEERYHVNVVSITSDSIHFFSDETGIYVKGNNTNFRKRGREWERPANFEFFSKDGQLIHQQSIGLRVSGNKGRTAPQKSLLLYARESYGDERFRYAFFNNKKQSTFKRLILRSASSNDWKNTLFKNELAQKLSENLNFEHPGSIPVIAFINGEYWGIHHLSERTDENYIGDYRNINDKEIDYLSSNAIVEQGSNQDYLSLKEFILQNDLSDPTNYNYVSSQINISNFIDYNCAELFFSNTDWPNNNIKFWKNQKQGKWEWIFSDCDECLSYEYYNLLGDFVNLNNYREDFPQWSTFLLHHLLKNERFKQNFRFRFDQLINTDFSSPNLLRQIEEMKNTYAPLVSEHSLRWNAPATLDDWNEAVRSLKSFAVIRPSVVKQQLQEYFQLPFVIFPNPSSGAISIEWKGDYTDIKEVNFKTITGQIVYTSDIENGSEIDLSFLKSGVYLAEVILKSQVYYQKIILY
jgi:hypothetical protein